VAFPFKLPARYVYEGPTLDGGQGAVYVCRDKYLDRKVAIKVMNGVSDATEIGKELAAIQGVRSRHVARIYDLVKSQHGDKVGLVQEYVPGPNVKDYAKNTDISHDYLRVLYQIACGISDIHESGKIHRDIKPSNIKLDAENVVKILDFGLASDAGPDAETIDARGTPCYIAPELYVTPPIKYTAAVDIFAFGVTARVIAENGAILPAFRQTPPYANPFPSFSTSPVKLSSEVAVILDLTLESNPRMRPSMASVRDVLSRRLLYGKHRAVVTSGTMHELSTPGKSISLKTGVGAITIKYDGLCFAIESLAGDCYINNSPAQVGETLPSSCVITLGAPLLGSSRTFVPFNVSHPGVVL
jgi:eukaryotic-like serine/threonine-protein kinase